MTAFRARIRLSPLILSLSMLLATGPLAHGREASFMPPSGTPTDQAQSGATNAPMPISSPAPAAAAPAAAPVSTPAPVNLGAPVQSGKLPDINPESTGLLGDTQGGLGAAMWKGTPYALVERLMPALELPTASPTLNNLAARFLLTTAGTPEGTPSTPQSLMSMRVEKLIALGGAADAWKLAGLARDGQIDDITMRQAAEAALVSPVADEVCSKLPALMKTRADAGWQKALMVCQLRAKDAKAAQLNLDLMRSENIQDEALFDLAEKNIIGGGKFLPRRLTPLSPLVLALLRLSTLPVRDEVYARPGAALIPELLKTSAENGKVRLDLAERAAARGLVGAATLEDVYRGETFQAEALANASGSAETGARLRALLFQAVAQTKTPQDRATVAVKFLQNLDAAGMNGSAAQVVVDMIGDIKPSADLAAVSDRMVLLYILVGKPNVAMQWLAVAQAAAATVPNVAAGLADMWPLLAVSGLESDATYAKDLGVWLEAMLKKTETAAGRGRYESLAAVLLLLQADGYAVPAEDWAKVTGAPEFEKRRAPPALLLEQLRTAGTMNRRGEAALDSLLVMGGDDGASLSTIIEAIRALRLAGLASDATGLTRETVVAYLNAP